MSSRFIPDDDIEDSSSSMAVGGGNSNSNSNSNSSSSRARADSADYVVEEMDVYLVRRERAFIYLYHQ